MRCPAGMLGGWWHLPMRFLSLRNPAAPKSVPNDPVGVEVGVETMYRT
jgi:hypothetical protein